MNVFTLFSAVLIFYLPQSKYKLATGQRPESAFNAIMTFGDVEGLGRSMSAPFSTTKKLDALPKGQLSKLFYIRHTIFTTPNWRPSLPTKFRLPNFIPVVKTKVLDLSPRESQSSILSLGEEPLAEDRHTFAQEPKLAESAKPDALDVISGDSARFEVSYKGGHHEQAQESEISFNHRLSALERFAAESAQAQAAAGLPRINVETPDELPVESQLRARAAEIFFDWKSRAERRTQDALQRSVLDAGCGVVSLRHAIDQARLSQFKAAKVQQDLALAKAETVGRSRTVEYVSQIPFWFYLTLVGILMAVEWIANVAVFRSLLPIDKGADLALRNMADHLAKVPWLGGIERLLGKFAISPEAGILAIGTIFTLMYLAHVCGESRRRIVAFRKDDDPGIAHGMVSEGRQAKNAFWTSVLGIVAILLFLTISRWLIGGIAEQQYQAAHNRTQEIQRQHDAAIASGKEDEATSLLMPLRAAQNSEESRLDNRDYAASIKSINGTIIFLNLGLVMVATIAAYQASKGKLTESRIVDPAVGTLETELEKLYAELMNHRHKARTLDLEIQSSIARAHYLSKAAPTTDWQAKAERLNAVISLFRTTNATVRGIDTQNILAFRQHRAVDITAPEPNEMMLPPELAECEAEFKRLKQQLDFLRSDLLPGEATRHEKS